MNRPENARFSPSHEWAIVKDGLLTMGISDFAVEHLGDIVFVDLPETGRTVAAGETVCEIESVKAVGEVYAPAAGTIEEVNSALGDDPSALGSDPFGAGWLLKIRLSDDAALQKMMDRAAYEKHLETADPG